MDIASSVTTFSHILNIKEKLFPRNKDVATSIEDGSNEQKYCSLLLEHSYDPRHIGLIENEKIELVIAKKSDFTIPIRHLDWVFMDYKLDSLKPINGDLPELFLVKDDGCIFCLRLEDILQAHIKYLELKGRKLKKSLKSLAIQCTYADNYKQTVIAPKSLRKSLYELHCAKKST